MVKQKVQFLDDDPVSEDQLSGAHRRTADVIMDTILSNSKSKAIALTGSWGSGKSSVIEMLQDGKDFKQELSTFVFNAWSHDKEPIRLAFMQELTKQVFPDNKNWQQKIEYLAGRLKSTKRIEPYGYWVMLAGVLITLGSRLVSLDKIHPDKLTYFALGSSFDSYALIYFWLPFCLILIPLLALAFTYKDYNVLSDYGKGATTQHYDSGVITSLEFQEAFKSVLEELPTDKILIVIDNLDRLEADSIQDYWSLLSVFFDIQDEKLKNKFWLLVPYDPDILKGHFKEQLAIGYEPVVGTGNESNAKDTLFQSFSEKTFQLTYRVPIPIMTDWESYMNQELNKVFPDIERIEATNIIQAYKDKNMSSVTPRAIRLFLNQLGALYLQAHDDATLYQCCIYLLYEDDIIRVIKSHQAVSSNKSIDSLRTYFLDDPDWKANLFSLYFNVLPDEAFTLVFSAVIKEGLLEGNHHQISHYKHHRGFLNIVKSVINSNSTFWLNGENETIGLIAYCLSNLDLPKSDELTSIYGSLYEISLKMENLYRLSSASVRGFLYLIEIFETKDTQYLSVELVDSLTSISGFSSSDINAQVKGERLQHMSINEWVDCCKTYIKFAKSNSHKAVLDNCFTLNLNASDYFYLLQLLTSDKEIELDHQDLAYFRLLKVDQSELMNEIHNLPFTKWTPFVFKVISEIDRNLFGDVLNTSSIFSTLRKMMVSQIEINRKYNVLKSMAILSESNTSLHGDMKQYTISQPFIDFYNSTRDTEEGAALAIAVTKAYNPKLSFPENLPHNSKLIVRKIKTYYSNNDFHSICAHLAQTISEVGFFRIIKSFNQQDIVRILHHIRDNIDNALYEKIVRRNLAINLKETSYTVEEFIDDFEEVLLSESALKDERYTQQLNRAIQNDPQFYEPFSILIGQEYAKLKKLVAT